MKISISSSNHTTTLAGPQAEIHPLSLSIALTECLALLDLDTVAALVSPLTYFAQTLPPPPQQEN
jgi:hypothetical protein